MTSPPEVVEIRIHGVHNTSPASMLGIRPDQVVQVAGDGLTGVYRAAPGVDLPGRDLAGRPIAVEAYSWGALTSGVKGVLGWVKRALWLGLLPFALANLAYWARVGLGEDSWAARVGARATRLGALLLTVFMVLTPCLIGIDLVAWQCFRGNSPGCSTPGALDFIAGFAAPRRLALGSLAPLAMIGVLWLLSRTTLARYEECTGEPAPAHRSDVLGHPMLWRGVRRTRQLQRVHLTVALAVVVVFSGAHLLAVADQPPLPVAVTVAVAVGLAIVATVWSMVIHPDDIDYYPEHTSRIVRWRRRFPDQIREFARKALPDWLLGAALATTAAHLAILALIDPRLDESRDFAGHNLWFIGVFVALTATHLSIFTGGRMSTRSAIGVTLVVVVLGLLALAIHLDPDWLPGGWPPRAGLIVLALLWLGLLRWHYGQGRRFKSVAWNGAGASVLLAAAAWVGLLFTTGVVTATANYLNGPGHGMADLVSHSNKQAKIDAESTALDPQAPDTYTAVGEVTADHAIVVVDGDLITVASGRLEMTALYVPDPDRSGPRADLAHALDSTRVTGGQVILDQPRLELRDSCLRETLAQRSPCTAESPDFVPAGALPLADDARVLITAVGPPVLLAVADPPAMPLVIPQVLVWSPMAQLVWLVAVASYGAFALLRFRRTRAALRAQLDADGIVPRRDHPGVQGARRNAALAHRAERLLDGIGAITAAIGLALITVSATGRPPWDLLPWTGRIATLSMWVAALLALALVLVASQLRTRENARKAVGVLWDLTTFWPRAAHPLAPPCYAERVVPELGVRLAWALRPSPDHAPGPAANTVILSGHSQGSAILVALVSRLSRADLARVRVVTYGSQIRTLYGRIFPRVLGPEALGYVPTPGPATLTSAWPDARLTPDQPETYDRPEPDPGLSDQEWAQRPLLDRVHLAGGSWDNFFRRTDPLGFRVFSDADAAPDHWVPEVPPADSGDPGPEVQGHSGYQHSPGYRGLVGEWTGEPMIGEPTGTTDVPPLPQP